MKVFYSDTFVLPLPTGHRFPIAKYRRLRERVSEFAESRNIELSPSPPARHEDLALVHTQHYLDKVTQGGLTELDQRRIGFPWSPQMVERSMRSTSATVAASRVALQDGVAVHLAGGTHHAFADAGQGFCVFNDVAVASLAHSAAGLPFAAGESMILGDDESALVEAIAAAIDDPVFLQRLVLEAREIASERFSWSSAARSLIEVVTTRRAPTTET